MNSDKKQFQYSNSSSKLNTSLIQTPGSQSRYRALRSSTSFNNKTFDQKSISQISQSQTNKQQLGSGQCIKNATVYISYDRYHQTQKQLSHYQTPKQATYHQRNSSNNSSLYESRVISYEKSETRVQDLQKQLKSIRQIKQKNQRIYKERISSLQRKLDTVDNRKQPAIDEPERNTYIAKIQNLQKQNKRLLLENTQIRSKSAKKHSDQQYNLTNRQNYRLITQNTNLKTQNQYMKKTLNKVQQQLNNKQIQITTINQQKIALSNKILRNTQQLTQKQNKIEYQFTLITQQQYRYNQLLQQKDKIEKQLYQQLQKKQKQIQIVKQNCAHWIHQLQSQIKMLEVSNSKLRANKISAIKQIFNLYEDYSNDDKNMKNRRK